ncbi:NUDIX hydrolase [Aeromicrobium sp. Leaf350]|uniref:NUDIX hydrolase n=1 Tax=Aeromicrobium sp. Leaf350 TaxID=2876565 RepID=UPI001E59C3FE|nr:NUDIX hydrolase [Aeromicrobium sp. Leaf350]
MRTRLPDGWEPVHDQDPVAPRDAATVALLRDTEAGSETYLLRRQPTMAFAAGMSVFPGGSTQAGDDEPLGWVGPSVDAWAARLRCTPEIARALVVAAVRETFEESGILLAGPDEHTTATELDTDEITQTRLDLDGARRSLADVLGEHGWVLRSDLLGAWAHWITPSFEPRRFDTRFFVAAVPEGQRVGSLPGEADRAAWIAPQAALDSAAGGGVALMPPTVAVCRDLVGLRARDVVRLAHERVIETVEPRLVRGDDGAWYIENTLEDLS